MGHFNVPPLVGLQTGRPVAFCKLNPSGDYVVVGPSFRDPAPDTGTPQRYAVPPPGFPEPRAPTPTSG